MICPSKTRRAAAVNEHSCVGVAGEGGAGRQREQAVGEGGHGTLDPVAPGPRGGMPGADLGGGLTEDVEGDPGEAQRRWGPAFWSSHEASLDLLPLPGVDTSLLLFVNWDRYLMCTVEPSLCSR